MEKEHISVFQHRLNATHSLTRVSSVNSSEEKCQMEQTIFLDRVILIRRKVQ